MTFLRTFSQHSTVYVLLGWEGPSEAGQFQGLSDALLCCLFPVLQASLQNGVFYLSVKVLNYHVMPFGGGARL